EFFNSLLGEFLRNARYSFTVPGGAQFEAQRAEKTIGETPDTDRAKREESEAAVEQVRASKQPPGENTAALIYWFQRAAYWEARFLNLFLVPRTQELLRAIKFAGRPQTREEIEETGLRYGRDLREVEIMINVLLGHALLVLREDGFSINQKGIDFLSFVDTGDFPVQTE
ncbi:MAG: hypothetical protein KAU35_11010, partial [candidate division Zixibacteria bacterium]|nr:hypothetical protein [candidate division Zixibacteria bacterium]